MAQAWILTVCVLLCLRPVTAIRCRSCTIRRPGRPCYPPGNICHFDGAVCMVVNFYKGDNMTRKMLSCFVDRTRTCGKTGILPSTGERYKHVCCSYKDFCSDAL